jgi:hypothetical protein
VDEREGNGELRGQNGCGGQDAGGELIVVDGADHRSLISKRDLQR